jgi:hypothetical protein
MFGRRPEWDDDYRDGELDELAHRGREISRLSWEQEERRRGQLLRRMPPRLGLPWTVFVVLVLLPVLVKPTSDNIIGILLAIVVGLVIIIATMLLPKRPPRAVRVYENGVLVDRLLAGEQYLPWGSFDEWSLKRVSDRPDVLTLKGELHTVVVTDELEGFNGWVDGVKRKVGDPTYSQTDPEGIWEGRRSAFTWHISQSVIAAFMIASSIAYVFVDSVLDPPDGYLVHTIVAIYLVVGIFFLPLFISLMLSPSKVRKYGLNVRGLVLVTVLVAVMLYGGFFATLYVSHPDIWRSEDDVSMHDEPVYSSVAPGVYTNDTVIADGPVAVRAGETLTLINCTLTFVPSPGWDYGIFVAKGGHLEIRASWVVCNDHTEGYSFEIHGSALIEDSIVQATSDRPDMKDHDSGIEIYNDSVVLRSTTVRAPIELGVMVYHCSPVIEDCTFETTGRSAIVASRGSPTISNCTFVECYRAIWLWESDAIVTNCTLLRNRNGIYSAWGSPTIDGCTFRSTNNTAILVDTNGAAVLGDNEFIGNGDDIVEKDLALGDLLFAVLMVIMMSSVFLVMTVHELRKKWKKGGKRRGRGRTLTPKLPDGTDAPPVTVQCPRCQTDNEVTTAQRPYEFRCEVCGSLLRLRE